MLSWIRSWWSRPTVEKEEEAKYDKPVPKYEGPIINVRVLPEQYKVNDKWWGTTLALKEEPANDKGENV